MAKFILLTKGKSAIIDDEDYNKINNFKWCADMKPVSKNYYAKRRIVENGKAKYIQMSRFIMNCPLGMFVDHINHNTLDNRKKNLRIVNRRQNQMNKSKNKKKSSKYKGVYWDNYFKKWKAEITSNYKKTYIGSFNNEIEAALSYNKYAIKMFGSFACLNVV